MLLNDARTPTRNNGLNSSISISFVMSVSELFGGEGSLLGWEEEGVFISGLVFTTFTDPHPPPARPCSTSFPEMHV